ncbi:MAG: hypothetical protein EZS28_046502, partial [Streblomastix strix]
MFMLENPELDQIKSFIINIYISFPTHWIVRRHDRLYLDTIPKNRQKYTQNINQNDTLMDPANQTSLPRQIYPIFQDVDDTSSGVQTGDITKGLFESELGQMLEATCDALCQ